MFRFLIKGVLLLTLVSASASASAHARTHVAITQIVQHPSLDAIRRGIEDEIKAQGLTPHITFENAHGSLVTAAQIAKKFRALSPDVVVAIATPSAQAAAKALKGSDIPLVFGAVTDPVGAKLVKTMEKTGGRVTGSRDLPPTHKQVALIQEVLPKANVIGTVYNPSEANNVSQLALMREACAAHGLTLLVKTASKTSEVGSATKALMGKVDALLLMNDNTVISALESLTKVAASAGVPVFTSDPDSVGRGAVAALANDQYQVGRETGKLVARILKGEDPAALPVEDVHVERVFVDESRAKSMGLVFPKEK